MTQLLEIIHRPRCEQFHVRNIFSLPDTAQGNVPLLMNKRLMLVSGNAKGDLLGSAELLTTLVKFL